jgi:hypothetical protein
MTRLYRRLEELLVLIRLAETTQLRKIAVTDGTGYNLGTGEGIFNAVSAVNTAMLESRKISDRVKRKKKALAEQGKFHGGGRPYGYEADGMTIRESEAAVIRECVGRVIAGEGLADIVRDLNDRGVPTSRGSQWRLSNTWRRLYNKRNIGIREYNGVDYPAQWPAIITPEEFRLLEAYQRAHQRSHFGKSRAARTYLLTGYTFCGACGAPMYGNAHKPKEGSEPRRRYRCKDYDNSMSRIGCGRVFRLAEPLEQFVMEAVFHRLDSEGLASLLRVGDGETEVASLLEQYEVRKQRLDELIEDYASGLLTRAQFSQAKDIADTSLESTRTALEKVQQSLTGASVRPGQTLRQAWDERGVIWRHNFVKLLVEKIVVQPGHPGSHTWNGFRFDPAGVQIVWRA